MIPLLALFFSFAVPQLEPPELVFYNAKVVTLNARSEIAEAVAIRGGNFVAIGKNADVRRLAGSADNVRQTLDRIGMNQNNGDEWIRVGGIKLSVDAGFEGGWMRQPYEEPWGQNGEYRGLQTYPSEEYKAVVRTLNRSGCRRDGSGPADQPRRRVARRDARQRLPDFRGKPQGFD